VSRAVFILLSVLWRNRQTIAYLILRPKPRNCRSDFVGQITKPQLPVLRPKPKNPSEWFWGQTTGIIPIGFEVKPKEIINLGFEGQPRNPTLVLRLNQEIRASLLHVHGADRTRHHLTS
jgi:hypothetical protein